MFYIVCLFALEEAAVRKVLIARNLIVNVIRLVIRFIAIFHRTLNCVLQFHRNPPSRPFSVVTVFQCLNIMGRAEAEWLEIEN
jgi:hypothetical protein